MALWGQTRDRALAREQLRQSLQKLVTVLASGRVRLLIFLFAFLLMGWQMYFFVWRPLQAETTLPEGLTAAVRPRIEESELTKIQEARTQRLQYPAGQLGGADQYFAPSDVVGGIVP